LALDSLPQDTLGPGGLRPGGLASGGLRPGGLASSGVASGGLGPGGQGGRAGGLRPAFVPAQAVRRGDDSPESPLTDVVPAARTPVEQEDPAEPV